LPRALGLLHPRGELNLADGLIYTGRKLHAGEVASRIKRVLGTQTVRLVGDPRLAVRGIAFATETSRPNALNPLLARPEVNLLVAGEVHETETTAYVLDAIALGQPKALLLAGSIEMEEPAAAHLASWLRSIVALPVHYLPAPVGLREVDL